MVHSMSVIVTADDLKIITGNLIMVTGDQTILADATSGPIQITLPLAALVTGRYYFFKKTDASGNAVTIVGS